MEQKKAEELYGQILQSAQQIRTEIMSELADVISFGGQISQEDATELQNAARITGCAFDALLKRGVESCSVEGKPDLVKIKLNVGTFVCNKNAMGIHETQTPAVQVNVLPTASNKQEMESQESVPDAEEVSYDLAEKEALHTEDTPDTLKEESDITKDQEEISEEKEEFSANPAEKAVIIGGDPAPVCARIKNDFADEHRKHADMFTFDSYRIGVAHAGSQGTEEMSVTIAPLPDYEGPSISVPILVAFYYRGRMYMKSTLDCEDGKTMVKIDINDYSFLCRGEYKEDGKFYSSIVTTGTSSDNGDLLNILSRQQNGNAYNTGGNHIRFHYNAEEERDGIVEVFPIELEEPEFVIVSRTNEYTDYFHLSHNRRSTGTGLSKVVIYEEGMRKELVVNWDGQYLEAELVEV